MRLAPAVNGGGITPEQFARTIQQIHDAPYQPQELIIVTPEIKRRYDAAMARLRRLYAELDALGRNQHVRRYQLQRQLGRKRRHLLLPRPLELRLRALERKRWERQHRNDPEW